MGGTQVVETEEEGLPDSIKEFEKQLQYDFANGADEKEIEAREEADAQQVDPFGQPELQESETVMPKRRGRPPGSKNKTAKPDAVEAREVTLEVPLPKRRGRPPGSKNKTRETTETTEAAPPKRRGRPPGVKSKTAYVMAAPNPNTAGLVQVLDLVTKISQLPNAEYLMGVLHRFATVLAA